MRDLVQYSGAHKTRKLNPHGIGHELNIELNSVGQKKMAKLVLSHVQS